MSKNTRNRILLTAVAAMLLVTLTIGGTLAWLKANTDSVVNTFTAAGIEIDLYETREPDGDVVAKFKTGWEAQLVPGMNYTKDPTVEVLPATSVDVFLFVKFEYTSNMPALTYSSKLTTDAGWTKVGTTTTENGVTTEVWGRVVKTTDTTKSWYLLNDVVTSATTGDMYDNGSVKVPDTADKTQTAIEGELKWTAYAVQTTGFAANIDNVTEEEYAAAWAEASTLN